MIGKIVLMSFPVIMAFAASSDLFTMRISNRVVLVLVAAFLALALYVRMPPDELALHLACGGVVLVCAFALFTRGWIGGGDAKLAAATSLWLGFAMTLPYLVYASLIGGVMALVLISLRRWMLPRFLLGVDWVVRLHDRRSGIPYGIALAVAGLITYTDTTLFQQLMR